MSNGGYLVGLEGSSELLRGVRIRSRTAIRGSLEFACIFLAYLVAGEIGLAVPFTDGNVSPLWPPAGIALAAFLLYGYRVWPAVALAAFAVNFFSPIPSSAAAGIAIGNTAGPLCGAWLLRQRPYFDCSLARMRCVLALTFFGMLGTAVSATIGALALFYSGVNAWSGFAMSWLIWWLGDSMGVVVVTPLILTLPRLRLASERRLAELACLLLGSVASSLMVFDPRVAVLRPETFGFVVFPFVLWGAIRFELAGAATVSVFVSWIAVWGTAHGFGPFLTGNPIQNVTLLASFLGVTSLSGIMLAAAVAERATLIREQTAREARARSAQSYREIVETAYEGIWKIDAQYVTSFVNTRMADLLGCRPEEMVGRPLFDFMFEEDVEQKRADLQRRREGVSEHLINRYRRKDGSVLWARVATSPVKGADGTFEGALAMISDITEQRQAEAEVSRSREMIGLMTRAVEQTADSVIITDRQGTIEYVNPAFEATTGYTREEAIGRTPRMLKSALHSREFYAELWGRILNGEPFRGTLVNRKKSGELFRTEQTITPIKDDTGAITHFVSVLKDVTEIHKQRERALQFQMARRVQQRFYANPPVEQDHFDLATIARPAEETGGDYLDLIDLGNQSICIGIGDVSGHGLDAALVMALTRAYVRAFAQVETDLARILERVNRMLLADLDENRYVTLLLACLNPDTRTLSYAGAGHIPGLVVNCSGSVARVLESSGPPLGLFDDARYQSSSITLRPEQVVILLTDGITEATSADDVEFGSEGVLEYVRDHPLESARELATGIFQAARSVAGNAPQLDDMTEVIMRVR